ncbi:MAG: BlaI/MecI/CopY family transcriptional regulator [Planctomycetota bacterium]
MAKQRKVAVLTNLEVAVMKVVWEAGGEPLTVREVVERLNQVRGRSLAYNTVQTILTILKDKGVVRSRPGPGRAFEFTARLSRDEVSTTMVDDLVARLFDGQAHPLLLKLVEHESLRREDLEALRRLIDKELHDERSVDR